MRKLALLLFALATVAGYSPAPSNYLSITTTSGIVDAFGTAMAQGTFCAYATDATDSPIAFQIGASFQAVKSTVCSNIVAGTLATMLLLANPAATAPLNIRYHMTLTNSQTHVTTQYPAVSIVVANGITTWDRSAWNPSLSQHSIPENTGPIGPVGPAPTLIPGTATPLAAGASPTVDISGTNPYAINLGIPAGTAGTNGTAFNPLLGTGAPGATCSSSVNAGLFYTNTTTNALYQCNGSTSTSASVGGGGASYPGVTSNGTNGINVTGTVAAGTSTPTSLGNTGVTLPDGSVIGSMPRNAGLLGTNAFGQPIVVGSNAANQGEIVLAPSCGTAANCYTIYDDVQTAMTATYTAGAFSGGSALTQQPTDVGTSTYVAYGAVTAATESSVTLASTSALTHQSGVIAWKSAGSPALRTCWNTSSASAGTALTLPVSPVGGSGHVLMLIEQGGTSTSGATYTFTITDNSSSGQTWSNLSTSAIQSSKGGGTLYGYYNVSYAVNIAAGAYTLTFTTPNLTYRSIIACEISGVQSSSAMDSSALAYNVGTTTAAAVTTSISTTSNDFLVAMDLTGNGTFVANGANYGGTGTVTTLSSDPPFVAGDVGKKFLSTTNCDATNGYITCYKAFPPGTITAYNGPHSVSVSTVPIFTPTSNGTNFTGWFLWGHDDGAAINAAWNAAQTLPGMSLRLPCGAMFIGQPPFISASTGGVYNPSISGCSGGGTLFVPTADFNYSLASGGLIYSYPATNFAGFGTLFQNAVIWSQIRDLTIWGAGMDGNAVTTQLPIFNLSVASLNNVWINAWNWNASVPANTMPAMKATSLSVNNSGAWSAGTGGLLYTGDQSPTNQISVIRNCLFGVQGNANTPGNPGYALQMQGGHLTSESCQWYAPQSGGAVKGVNITGGVWTSIGDQSSGITATGGAINLTDTQTSLLGVYGVQNQGAIVRAQNSELSSYTQSAGTLIDEGGNYACATIGWVGCSGAITPWTTNPHSNNSITGGNIIGAGSVTGTLVAASNLVLSANWGTSAAVSSPGGYTSPVIFTITNGTASTGASPTITYTFPVPYAQAPLWCNATQTGGTNAIGTFTSSSITATRVTFTYSQAPTAGSTEIVQVSCAAKQ